MQSVKKWQLAFQLRTIFSETKSDHGERIRQ